MFVVKTEFGFRVDFTAVIRVDGFSFVGFFAGVLRRR